MQQEDSWRWVEYLKSWLRRAEEEEETKAEKTEGLERAGDT